MSEKQKNQKRKVNIDELKEKIKTVDLEELRYKAEEKKEELEEFVKKKPLLSVLIALGAGIVIGKILRD